MYKREGETFKRKADTTAEHQIFKLRTGVLVQANNFHRQALRRSLGMWSTIMEPYCPVWSHRTLQFRCPRCGVLPFDSRSKIFSFADPIPALFEQFGSNLFDDLFVAVVSVLVEWGLL